MILILTIVLIGLFAESLYRYLLIKRAVRRANSGPTQTGEFWLGDKKKPHFSLLLLGDSIAAASGIEDFKNSVGGLLANKIAQNHHVHYLNLAKNGNTVRAMSLKNIEGHWDMIIVLASSNDLIHLRTAEALGHDLGHLFTELRQHTKKIVFAGPGNVAGAKIFPLIFRMFIKPRQHSFNRMARKVAASCQVAYVPVEKHIEKGSDPKYVSSDKLHPNVLGHKFWFGMVWPEVTKLVQL